jgi:hypothetical protein
MKKRIFGWITTLIGIVMALAIVEVTAIVWLMLEDGHYTSAEQLFERTQNTYVRDLTKGTTCRYVDTLFPHPISPSSITATRPAACPTSTISAC